MTIFLQITAVLLIVIGAVVCGVAQFAPGQVVFGITLELGATFLVGGFIVLALASVHAVLKKIAVLLQEDQTSIRLTPTAEAFVTRRAPETPEAEMPASEKPANEPGLNLAGAGAGADAATAATAATVATAATAAAAKVAETMTAQPPATGSEPKAAAERVREKAAQVIESIATADPMPQQDADKPDGSAKPDLNVTGFETGPVGQEPANPVEAAIETLSAELGGREASSPKALSTPAADKAETKSLKDDDAPGLEGDTSNAMPDDKALERTDDAPATSEASMAATKAPDGDANGQTAPKEAQDDASDPVQPAREGEPGLTLMATPPPGDPKSETLGDGPVQSIDPGQGQAASLEDAPASLTSAAETTEANVASADLDLGSEAEPELYVVEERSITGLPARILSDGTIEAETAEGWMRFENIEHLNEYLSMMDEAR